MSAAVERLLSLEDVADRLQVSDQSVRRWIKAGKLAAYKPGLEWRIRPSDLEEFLQAHSSPKVQAPLPDADQERRYRPTEREIRAVGRWVSYLEPHVDKGKMSREEIEHELDALLGFGPVLPAASDELFGRAMQLGRRLLHRGKELQIRELAEAEAGVVRLEEWRKQLAS
jgi:excisionase family DNA binding protein